MDISHFRLGIDEQAITKASWLFIKQELKRVHHQIGHASQLSIAIEGKSNLSELEKEYPHLISRLNEIGGQSADYMSGLLLKYLLLKISVVSTLTAQFENAMRFDLREQTVQAQHDPLRCPFKKLKFGAQR